MDYLLTQPAARLYSTECYGDQSVIKMKNV